MTTEKHYVAYKGSKFTIEWYYTETGNSPPLDFFTSLNVENKIKVMQLFELLGTHGKILNIEKFRNEGDGIFAFKPKPYRFLSFFFQGGKIIVTNGFIKKQDKLPPNEKKRAQRFEEDYKQRVKEGKYYEQ